jgi:hypothetical protein
MFRKLALTLIPGVALFSTVTLVSASLTRTESSKRTSIRATTTVVARSGYIVASS